jgi:hypothetical protein
MTFNTDEMQTIGSIWICLPGIPAGQKIHPQSKAGFKNAKALLFVPGSDNLTALKKHRACLF